MVQEQEVHLSAPLVWQLEKAYCAALEVQDDQVQEANPLALHTEIYHKLRAGEEVID